MDNFLKEYIEKHKQEREHFKNRNLSLAPIGHSAHTQIFTSLTKNFLDFIRISRQTLDVQLTIAA